MSDQVLTEEIYFRTELHACACVLRIHFLAWHWLFVTKVHTHAHRQTEAHARVVDRLFASAIATSYECHRAVAVAIAACRRTIAHNEHKDALVCTYFPFCSCCERNSC